MALRLSTGAVNLLADTKGLKGVFNGGCIDIYSGGQPASADAAETGTKLMRITIGSSTAGSDGVTFGTAGTGYMPKSASVWSGTVGVAGVAGWFRLYGSAGTSHTAGVTLGADSTAYRCDGNVGVSGSDLVLANTTLTAGATVTIDQFTLQVPQS